MADRELWQNACGYRCCRDGEGGAERLYPDDEPHHGCVDSAHMYVPLDLASAPHGAPAAACLWGSVNDASPGYVRGASSVRGVSFF